MCMTVFNKIYLNVYQIFHNITKFIIKILYHKTLAFFSFRSKISQMSVISDCSNLKMKPGMFWINSSIHIHVPTIKTEENLTTLNNYWDLQWMRELTFHLQVQVYQAQQNVDHLLGFPTKTQCLRERGVTLQQQFNKLHVNRHNTKYMYKIDSISSSGRNITRFILPLKTFFYTNAWQINLLFLLLMKFQNYFPMDE